MTEPEWEYVGPSTYRFEVPGGWIYRVSGGQVCFVPTQDRHVREVICALEEQDDRGD